MSPGQFKWLCLDIKECEFTESQITDLYGMYEIQFRLECPEPCIFQGFRKGEQGLRFPRRRTRKVNLNEELGAWEWPCGEILQNPLQSFKFRTFNVHFENVDELILVVIHEGLERQKLSCVVIPGNPKGIPKCSSWVFPDQRRRSFNCVIKHPNGAVGRPLENFFLETRLVFNSKGVDEAGRFRTEMFLKSANPLPTWKQRQC